MSNILKSLKTFKKKYPEELRVGLLATVVAFFFTHGLPLWNEDYSQWLAQANGSFFDLVLRIVLPITWSPETWGYSDRPVQALIYKIFHLVFGYWGTGFYLMKSIAFGAFCGVIYRWLRVIGTTKQIALITILLLMLSVNSISSLLTHSDFMVYSQIIVVLTLWYSLAKIENGPESFDVWKKGFKGFPKDFTRFLFVFFLIVYFGTKLKGDVRLVPLVLLVYLYAFEKEKFKVYLAPFAVSFLATLPWSKDFFKKLPPFIPGVTGYEGWTYGNFSIGRIFEFLFSGFLNLTSPGLSVFAAIGLFIILGLVVYLCERVYRDKLKPISKGNRFFVVWFLVGLFSVSLLSKHPGENELRYTVILLVPGVFLLASALSAAFRDFGKHVWFKPVILSIVVLQCFVHVYRDVNLRKDVGRMKVAVNSLYRVVEEKYPQVMFGLMPGFNNYGYKDVNSFALKNKKIVQNANDLSEYQPGNSYLASWSPALDSRFSVEFTAPGCGVSLFDVIFKCRPSNDAVLLKYVGTVQEEDQARQLAAQGNFVGAKEVLQSYLQRDPWNHGIVFALSLYAYRLGDFPLMERLYDQIGAYYPEYPSVVYNWGLAKNGVGKSKEAAVLLEKAYAMAPRDYAIGFNLADAYHKAGKKRRALATLKELISAYPNDGALKSAQQQWSK